MAWQEWTIATFVSASLLAWGYTLSLDPHAVQPEPPKVTVVHDPPTQEEWTEYLEAHRVDFDEVTGQYLTPSQRTK